MVKFGGNKNLFVYGAPDFLYNALTALYSSLVVLKFFLCRHKLFSVEDVSQIHSCHKKAVGMLLL